MYLLSNDQIEQFHRDGCLIIRDKIVEDNDIQSMLQDINTRLQELQSTLLKFNKIEQECLSKEPIKHGNSNILDIINQKMIELERKYKDAPILLHTMYASKLSTAMGTILSNTKIIDCIQQLLGHKDISGHPEWNLRVKTPLNKHFEVPWHQDAAYLAKGAEYFPQITVWIPLVDINESNGPLHIYKDQYDDDQSKKKEKKELYHHTLQKLNGDEYNTSWYLEIKESELNNNQKEINNNVISCNGLKPGSIVLMKNTTPHRSTRNQSDSVRWTIDIRYQRTQDPSGFYAIDSDQSLNEQKMRLRSNSSDSINIDYSQWSGSNDILMKSNDYSVNNNTDTNELNATIEGPWFDRWK